MNNKLQQLSEKLAEILNEKQLKLAVAESCTGGGIAYALTGLSGSSAWFERGFVTYSNEAKHEMLGVPNELLIEYGAVSEAVAKAMAGGAVKHSYADIAVSVTGVAGPNGGSKEKPVGTVWFGFCVNQELHALLKQFDGDRASVREQSISFALEEVMKLLQC